MRLDRRRHRQRRDAAKAEVGAEVDGLRGRREQPQQRGRIEVENGVADVVAEVARQHVAVEGHAFETHRQHRRAGDHAGARRDRHRRRRDARREADVGEQAGEAQRVDGGLRAARVARVAPDAVVIDARGRESQRRRRAERDRHRAGRVVDVDAVLQTQRQTQLFGDVAEARQRLPCAAASGARVVELHERVARVDFATHEARMLAPVAEGVAEHESGHPFVERREQCDVVVEARGDVARVDGAVERALDGDDEVALQTLHGLLVEVDPELAGRVESMHAEVGVRGDRADLRRADLDELPRERAFDRRDAAAVRHAAVDDHVDRVGQRHLLDLFEEVGEASRARRDLFAAHGGQTACEQPAGGDRLGARMRRAPVDAGVERALGDEDGAVGADRVFADADRQVGVVAAETVHGVPDEDAADRVVAGVPCVELEFDIGRRRLLGEHRRRRMHGVVAGDPREDVHLAGRCQFDDVSLAAVGLLERLHDADAHVLRLFGHRVDEPHRAVRVPARRRRRRHGGGHARRLLLHWLLRLR